MSYISPVFDVTKYGAVGDGTTNDTTAVGTAISAAVSAGGGAVYPPSGTYLVGSLAASASVTLIFFGDGLERSTVSLLTSVNQSPLISLTGGNSEFRDGTAWFLA